VKSYIRWPKGWRRTVGRRIATSILTVSWFTGLTGLLAMVKDMTIANYFGTSDEMDAFLIALMLPMFAVNVLGGSLPPAFVPTYIEVRERSGHEEAQQLVSMGVVGTLTLFGVATIALVLSADSILPLLGTGFPDKKLDLAGNLTFVLAPVAVLGGLSFLFSAILNAAERFALAAAAPALSPLSIIVAILAFQPRMGIYALPLGLVVGWFLRSAVLVAALHKKGHTVFPRMSRLSPALKEILRQYGPATAGSFLMVGTVVVDQAMAASLGSGSVAALSYGNKVVSFLLGVGTLGIGTVTLPHFSRMIAERDWRALRHTLGIHSKVILAITVPITLLVVFASGPIITVLFERGAFDATDTALVSRIQALYVLQLPFYVLGVPVVRLISSLKANHILMWGSGISLVLNVALNLLLMKHLGVAGIALSTSIVYAAALAFLGTMAWKVLRRASAD